jgi:hypothetical protein
MSISFSTLQYPTLFRLRSCPKSVEATAYNPALAPPAPQFWGEIVEVDGMRFEFQREYFLCSEAYPYLESLNDSMTNGCHPSPPRIGGSGGLMQSLSKKSFLYLDSGAQG